MNLSQACKDLEVLSRALELVPSDESRFIVVDALRLARESVAAPLTTNTHMER